MKIDISKMYDNCFLDLDITKYDLKSYNQNMENVDSIISMIKYNRIELIHLMEEYPENKQYEILWRKLLNLHKKLAIILENNKGRNI